LIGDIELFYRQARAPIVAITGSNAKSTVTTLVGEMAKAEGVKVAVGGNLGTPALELLDDATELYVLELSSFQLELVNTFSAKVAAFLNISEDHMDRYATLNDYIAAKKVIFNRCETAVFNIEDHHTWPASTAGCKRVTFGIAPQLASDFGLVLHQGATFLARRDMPLLNITELQLAGMHNVNNCLAALAIGEAAGLSLTVMCEVLKHFTGLPHRCQAVKTLNGIRYIDDSKGTNVGATIAAIEGLADKQKKNIVLIAGGEGKGADFSLLHDICAKSVKACVLIGRDARLIASALKNATQIVYALDMPGAVQAATRLASANDIVLLSPACASFDMFRNYEHRGECFVEAVRALPAEQLSP
jgi:UDP-N-acetylmuramoylalanine--D-glutamate ligase